jgi:alkylation response protein AidB-like acyl-CoA dehydrogenase
MAAGVETDRERQMREAEELLGTDRTRSFARELFFGRFDERLAFPYPVPSATEQEELDEYLARVGEFLDREVDSYRIDREARIPEPVIRGLAELGVMSMSIPPQYGGLGLSQHAYCRVMELIGAVDGSIAVMVNAHQSIGLKSLLLFGSEEQKEYWLPRLARGTELAAFALTEPNAGSDAGGIETGAVPSADGSHYVLNGRKQWITNGGIASMLVVMAKVPGTQDEKGRERITAFLVTPDLPGFEVEAVALEKCGIRGTATAKLAFHDMKVPAENIIGPPGKGLRVALTLLDFGRTTFGATCTGAAKRCVADALRHARTRRQFGKPLGHFELVKKKLARMAALTFAMESGTYFTAGLMDRGLEDYMVETAMLKLFASEALWEIVNETIQIFGGRGYFTDQPYERMMRDARINLIGEGANDVLRTFIALVGMRDPGLGLKDVLDSVKAPMGGLGKLTDFARRHLPGQDAVRVPVRAREAAEPGRLLEEQIRTFGHAVEGLLIRHRESILEKQYLQARIADAATELFMMSAVVARLDAAAQTASPDAQPFTPRTGGSTPNALDLQVGRYYCRLAARRIRACLNEIGDNLDAETSAVADALLAR